MNHCVLLINRSVTIASIVLARSICIRVISAIIRTKEIRFLTTFPKRLINQLSSLSKFRRWNVKLPRNLIRRNKIFSTGKSDRWIETRQSHQQKFHISTRKRYWTILIRLINDLPVEIFWKSSIKDESLDDIRQNSKTSLKMTETLTNRCTGCCSRISDGCPGNAASRRARKLEWITGAASASASASTSASAPIIEAPSTFVQAQRWWKVSRSSWWAVVKPPSTATGRLPAARSTSLEENIAEGCQSRELREARRTRPNWSNR